MDRTTDLIERFFQTQAGDHINGTIKQLDLATLVCLRLLSADFVATFHGKSEDGELVPIAFQQSNDIHICRLDILEEIGKWCCEDASQHLRVRDIERIEIAEGKEETDYFARENSFAFRYASRFFDDESGATILLIAYWRNTELRLTEEVRQTLDLMARLISASLKTTDRAMAAGSFSERLSRLLPIFELPTSTTRYRQLVSQVAYCASAVIPDVSTCLMSKHLAGGEVESGEWQSSHAPEPEFRLWLEGVVNDILSEPSDIVKKDPWRILKETPNDYPAVVALPLLADNRRQFVLFIWSEKSSGFTEMEEDLLSLFAYCAQTVISNSCLIRKLSKANRLLEKSSAKLAGTETLAALTDMTSGVAHDFNNIFGGIIGRLQLLSLKVKDPQMKAALSKVEVMALEGADTVKRIQEFATTTKHKQTDLLDLNELVRSVVEGSTSKWTEEANRRSVTVSVSVPSEVQLIHASSDDLAVAIEKLIENAVEHSASNEEVKVKLESDGVESVITVTNKGLAIPEEDRRRIFYPFFTSKSERGAGLGLAIVYGVAGRHDGTVSLNCETDGYTSFSMTLPLETEKKEPSEITSKKSRSKKMNIMIVDDDDEIRGVLEDMLRIDGHQTVSCCDGYAALEQLKVSTYDAMITDLGMPGMSGLELAEQVHGFCPDMPIAVITGWGTQLQEDEIATRGIKAVLPKPFHLKEIKNLLVDLAKAVEMVTL